jgi:hypothetical protein
MDLQVVADAIAARFVAITAANGSDTETVTGTADLPDQVSKLALLVYPPTGTLEIGLSRSREDTLDFPVRLLRDPPANVPGRSQWLYSWVNALRDRVEMDMDLGLAYVAWAKPISLRMEIDGQQYSSVDGTFAQFDVVELIVQVRFQEIVLTVAI